MDEKRYQVFVSSTFEDLKEERRQVNQALLELECLPAAMEMFVATDDDQWTLIQEVIELSDYYVVIVGGRYGSITEEGISYTEKEFDYALSLEKPILAFVHRHPEKIPQGQTDATAAAKKKLDAFRRKVTTGRTVGFFETPHELGSEVSRAVARVTKRKPGVGWVRGDKAMTVDQEREMLALREQISALRNQVSVLEEQKRAAEGALVEDTAAFAQDSDPVTITVFSQVKPNYRLEDMTVYSAAITSTWGQVFRELAPLLVDETLEEEAEERLASHYYWTAATDAQRAALHFSGPRQLVVNYEDWEMIRTQLRALGLIDFGSKRRPPSDSGKYLRLTPKGDRYMTALIAVKRGVDPGADLIVNPATEGSTPSEPTAEPEPPQDE